MATSSAILGNACILYSPLKQNPLESKFSPLSAVFVKSLFVTPTPLRVAIRIKCARTFSERRRIRLMAVVSETGVEGKNNPREGLEETYAVIDTGKWECRSCGYVYDQSRGDAFYPVAAGIEFSNLPADWRCPTCGAAPEMFVSKSRQVAGFAQNQKYGFGTNSLTAGQKGILIWGSLALFFLLFLSGYFLN
eukprot:TRINITY_DN2154_c0_g1_i3.p1 TRINITY_DN2154_c0_g1~~TRINITY_DN2154_c0_g1_i3.p1  ORF type:complete len:192 (+),score=33.06 TRINITY_DN2154_c0_g1_i3:93-668(+)